MHESHKTTYFFEPAKFSVFTQKATNNASKFSERGLTRHGVIIHQVQAVYLGLQHTRHGGLVGSVEVEKDPDEMRQTPQQNM